MVLKRLTDMVIGPSFGRVCNALIRKVAILRRSMLVTECLRVARYAHHWLQIGKNWCSSVETRLVVSIIGGLNEVWPRLLLRV
jgi:hypothetical protein